MNSTTMLIINDEPEYYFDFLENRSDFFEGFIPLNKRQKTYVGICINRCLEIQEDVRDCPTLAGSDKSEAEHALGILIVELCQVNNRQCFLEISHIVNMEIMYWEDRMFGYGDHFDNSWVQMRRKQNAKSG